MDNVTEFEIQSMGELSYNNYCNNKCKCKGETAMAHWKDSDGNVAEEKYLDDPDVHFEDEPIEEDNWWDNESEDDGDGEELEDAWLHDELNSDDEDNDD